MENNKTKIVSMVALFALAVVLIGATYAYFAAQTGEGSSTDVKINASTVDTLTFETGSAISLNLNQDNFAQGKGNQNGSTFAKANLSANNKTNSATKHYYLYLNISSNTFTYSIDNNTPEILLQVKDSSGTAMTSITGLSYKTVTDGKGASISGFDITTKSGLITILDNREITTTSTKTDTWNITITFVNYNENQSANAGKSFASKVIIRENDYPRILSDVCNSGSNLVNCITTLSNKSDSSLTNIYYHNSNLANGAGDNSYRYAGSSEVVNNFVCFGSEENECPDDNLYRIIGVIDGKVKLIKWDYANSNLLGTDGGYTSNTFLKSNISTYKGKLTSVYIYRWCTENTDKVDPNKASNWTYSYLNTINFNINYINNIGESWANKIETTTWKLGGNTYENIEDAIPSTVYKNEITTPATSTTYDAKIGLMYVSDYMYGATPDKWTLVGHDYDDSTKDYRAATSVNWMYMGMPEWTISPYLVDLEDLELFGVFSLLGSGYVSFSAPSFDKASRPVFFLTPSVTYVSGTGTQTDPIRIN